MGKSYVPSNKFNVPLLLLFFIISTMLSVATSGIAALLGYWLSPPYAGIVLSLLAAVVIYWITLFSIKWSKNRNIAVARITIFLTSTIVLFFHFSTVSSVKISLGGTIANVSLGMNSLTLERIVVGSFAYLRLPFAPFANALKMGGGWIFYLLLAALFFILIPQFAAEQAKEPFSEEYNNWMTKVPSIIQLDVIPDREQRIIVTALKTGDVTALLRRPQSSLQSGENHSIVVFYKVKNAHTGFVGIENYHQKYNAKQEILDGKYQTIEFIQPIQIGTDNSEQLETALNIQSGTMANQSFSAIPEPCSTIKAPHEHGYRVYRTTGSDDMIFDSDNVEKAKQSELLRHYRRSPDRELSESFQCYIEESEKEERRKQHSNHNQ